MAVVEASVAAVAAHLPVLAPAQVVAPRARRAQLPLPALLRLLLVRAARLPVLALLPVGAARALLAHLVVVAAAVPAERLLLLRSRPSF